MLDSEGAWGSMTHLEDVVKNRVKRYCVPASGKYLGDLLRPGGSEFFVAAAIGMNFIVPVV